MAELQNVSGIFGGRKSLPTVSHVSINLSVFAFRFESSSDMSKQDSRLINRVKQSPVQNFIAS